MGIFRTDRKADPCIGIAVRQGWVYAVRLPSACGEARAVGSAIREGRQAWRHRTGSLTQAGCHIAVRKSSDTRDNRAGTLANTGHGIAVGICGIDTVAVHLTRLETEAGDRVAIGLARFGALAARRALFHAPIGHGGFADIADIHRNAVPQVNPDIGEGVCEDRASRRTGNADDNDKEICGRVLYQKASLHIAIVSS